LLTPQLKLWAAVKNRAGRASSSGPFAHASKLLAAGASLPSSSPATLGRHPHYRLQSTHDFAIGLQVQHLDPGAQSGASHSQFLEEEFAEIRRFGPAGPQVGLRPGRILFQQSQCS
jgi:hypothetical protein